MFCGGFGLGRRFAFGCLLTVTETERATASDWLKPLAAVLTTDCFGEKEAIGIGARRFPVITSRSLRLSRRMVRST